MPQRGTTLRLAPGKQIKLQKSSYGIGANAPPSTDNRVEHAEQSPPPLNGGTERRRQGGAHFLHARVEVFRRLQHLQPFQQFIPLVFRKIVTT